jgi:hypothetical protein
MGTWALAAHAIADDTSSSTSTPTSTSAPAPAQPSTSASASASASASTSASETDGGPIDIDDALAPHRAEDCLSYEETRGSLGQIVRGLRDRAGNKPFSAVHLSGLVHIDPQQLALLIEQPINNKPVSVDMATLLLARLSSTGLFSIIDPVVHDENNVRTLEVQLTEAPFLKQVTLRGMKDSRSDELLEALLDSPPAHGFTVSMSFTNGHFHMHHGHSRGHDNDESNDSNRSWSDSSAHRAYGCTAAQPPLEWFAHWNHNQVVPGLLYLGLPGSLRRLIFHLHGHGYLLAHADAHLSPDGNLEVDVDEGKLAAIELRGVHPSLEPKVRAEMDLNPGQPFLASELDRALDRVHGRFPFLRIDQHHVLRSGPVEVTVTPDTQSGGVSAHATTTTESQAPRRHHHHDDSDDDDDDDDVHEIDVDLNGFPENYVEHGRRLHGVELQGDTLVIWFRPVSHHDTDIEWTELMRHTQVTGFAPGLLGTVRYWDEGDRVHVSLDGQFNVNTRRPGHEAPPGSSILQAFNAEERFDEMVGLRAAIPAIDMAEIGGQVHSLTDTADRWHISPVDSYLYSLLINRPESEYYRRSGVTAFVTEHLFEQLTVGLEYKRDQYDPMTSLGHVFTIFNSSEPAFPNAPTQPANVGSMLGRLEWSTRKASIYRVGSRRRDVERSIVERGAFERSGFDTMNTFEFADPRLGGTSHFTRLVSDNILYLATSDDSGFKLRARGAGGNGDRPLPKHEALGGWSDLRGYNFDEFRGNRSVLGTVEYHWHALGAFADIGTVRDDEGDWNTPKLGVGGELNFGDSVQLAAAWRTDSRAQALPSVRLLFERTF